MILIAANDIVQVTDPILWAGLKFCIQCEALRSGIRNRNLFKIIDMSELSQLSGTELYILGHGYPNGTAIDVEGLTPSDTPWADFGALLKTHLPTTMTTIHVMSCFAAAGPPGNTGLHKLAQGIGKTGMTYYGYIGPAVGNIVTGPVRVVDVDSNPIDDVIDTQTVVKQTTVPELKLKAWRMTHSGASRVDTAAAAAEINWDFFQSFTSVFEGKGYFYGPTTDGAKRIEVKT
ncbi:MAG: hypothetical protein JWO38_1471 [Gemmataceae bacterium]|nr:hypothetical protein [Gemmataceae bacterium]